MKKILLVFLAIILFSCESTETTGEKENIATITLNEACTQLNTDFIQKVKELEICKDDGCGITEHETWFNTNNYCNTKYDNSIITDEAPLADCFSLLFKITSTCNEDNCITFNVTKEEISTYLKQEIEDLNITCKKHFETNLLERCEMDYQSYLEVWKNQCNPTEEEIQNYLTSTSGKCSTLAENRECDKLRGGCQFNTIRGGCENFEFFYSQWVQNGSEEYECLIQE